jgi:hypothetical protein
MAIQKFELRHCIPCRLYQFTLRKQHGFVFNLRRIAGLIPDLAIGVTVGSHG